LMLDVPYPKRVTIKCYISMPLGYSDDHKHIELYTGFSSITH